MITTDIAWYRPDQEPLPGTLVLIAHDNGPDCDPEEFRIYILPDLYEWTVITADGQMGFVHMDSGEVLLSKAVLWTPFADLVLGIEGALDMMEEPS